VPCPAEPAAVAAAASTPCRHRLCRLARLLNVKCCPAMFGV
jgi:hypothetical protein